MAERLGDIIDLPEVKLVIELDDAGRDPDGILSSFVLTREVRDSLDIILKKIREKKGCGVFVKGNFGSGKSHFLTYLYLTVKGGGTQNDPQGPQNTAAVSLVKYPSSRPLEDIVLSKLGHEGEVTDREEVFERLTGGGTVLIIDELSEYLRSKPSSSAFNEDIRFLQFLGEFSFHHPLWIIASLQEWIEETGHISSSMFNRIKDRYPLRVTLTASHIEDIIDRRIVMKKGGADAIIEGVFSGLKQYYPHLPLKLEAFRKTYPLHPITVRFLAGLTPLFSQHRGVIQFVVGEVKKILDRPPDMLVTPEAIFDHFEERIREIPEYSRLARIVLDYYRTHIEEILPEAGRRDPALAAIKIMILSEISPLEKRKSYREIAEILLKKISTLTERINYDFMRDAVLEPLTSHQMYIIRDGDTYYIDPEVDEGIKMKGRIKEQRRELADRQVLFTEISRRLNLPYLPLSDLMQGMKVKFLWQNTLRECSVFLQHGGKLGKEEVKRAVDGIAGAIDAIFVIISPFSQNRERVGTLGELCPSPFLEALAFWVPREPADEETAFLEEFAARHRLLGEFPELRVELQRDEAKFRELMTSLYFGGEIVYGTGRNEKNLEEIGYLPLVKLLAHLLDRSLVQLHPNHYRIMPRIDYFSSHHLGTLFDRLIKTGKITLEEAEKKSLTPYIKGLLEPLGIIRKKGGSFLLSLDPENELVSHFLNLVSHEENLAALRKALKKGKWGMGEGQVNLFISAFIVSGHVIPLKDGEMVELGELFQLQYGEITELRHGKVLPPELLGYLHPGNFIWGEVEDAPTPMTQKAMWKRTVETARRARKLLEETDRFIERYGEYSIFKKLRVDSPLLSRLSLFFGSLTFSLSPAEGLEKTLSYLKENPELGNDLACLEGIHRLFSEHFQAINKYYLYLSHPALKAGEELWERKKSLASRMEDFLGRPDADFTAVKDEWDTFFERFTADYTMAHERHYRSSVFDARREVEANDAGKLLRRICVTVSSVTFDRDWWEIKRLLDDLPEKCARDLSYELFQNPVCRCGFKIGDEPPSGPPDFAAMCGEGVINFLEQLQLPENREKLDSCVMGLRDAGRGETAEKISSLLDVDPQGVSLPLLPPLLTDECLGEIERALKGRWKVREIMIEDLVRSIRGRRLKLADLKDIFLGWTGSAEDSILWVKSEEDSQAGWLGENLAKYGREGERLMKEIGAWAGGYERAQIEEKLEREGKIDVIRWASFSAEELIRFLGSEKLAVLRKRLRSETARRLWSSAAGDEPAGGVSDETMRDLLAAIRLFGQEGRYRGGEMMAKVIAPLNLLVEKLQYENVSGEKIDADIVDMIRQKHDGVLKAFSASPDRMEGVRDIEHVRDGLGGFIVVLDGLRFDLWHMLGEEFTKRGWTLRQDVFTVPAPSTTRNFRACLGLGEGERGRVGGRSYVLLKWAEKGIGKRRLRTFLETDADLKFLHFNFIDVKIHASSIDPYPLFTLIRSEFLAGVMPVLESIPSFTLVSDHGFADTKKLKARYAHGGSSMWEVVLPLAGIKRPVYF